MNIYIQPHPLSLHLNLTCAISVILLKNLFNDLCVCVVLTEHPLCSVQLPHHIHDVELERISDYIVVSQPQGFTLAWQGLTGSVYIKMSPEFVGQTCGLCGNFNADTQDDLKTSYGKFYLICYRFPVFEKN